MLRRWPGRLPASRCAIRVAVVLCAALTPAANSDAGPEIGEAKIEMRQPEWRFGEIQIDGGTRQDPQDWKATLEFFDAEHAGFRCTATIVAARAVITAAHCLPDAVQAEIKLQDDDSITLICRHHPRYHASNLTFDVAMCLADRPIGGGFAYENLDIELGDVKPAAILYLLGFGCRDVLNPGDPKLGGQLYGGISQVDTLPTDEGGHILTAGGVVICPGDSGGAAYLINTGAAPGEAAIPPSTNPRAIIGVNSGFLASARVSSIAAFTTAVATFVRDWARDNGVEICGVHAGTAGCRQRYLP
jgi:hypothetical protein